MKKTEDGTAGRRRSGWAWQVILLIVGIILGIPAGLFVNLVSPNIQSYFNPPYAYATDAGPRQVGCGEGWRVVQADVRCADGSATLSNAGDVGIGQATFADPHHVFPADYRISTSISGLSDGACAGLLFRADAARGTGYAYLICATQGSYTYQRVKFNGDQPAEVASSGSLNVQGTYQFDVLAVGHAYSLFVQGIQVDGYEDISYLETRQISLLLSPEGGGPATATFGRVIITAQSP
jgi:hypothetical protein